MEDKFITQEELELLLRELNKIKPGDLVGGKLTIQIIERDGELECTSRIDVNNATDDNGKVIPFPGTTLPQVKNLEVSSSKLKMHPEFSFALVKNWVRNQLSSLKTMGDDFIEKMFIDEDLPKNCFVDKNGYLYYKGLDAEGNEISYIKFDNGEIGIFTTEDRNEILIDDVIYPLDENGVILWDQGKEKGPKR